jgi:hypothetical protein
MITLDNKLKEELERDKNWAGLLLPKLKAVKNSGNGTTIHDTNGWINVITSSLSNAEYIKWDRQPEMINNLSHYLDKAEKWLISIASKGSNNE